MVVEITKKINLNRKEKPCVEDPDYNPVKCMEEWVANKAGCKIPTDQFLNDTVRLLLALPLRGFRYTYFTFRLLLAQLLSNGRRCAIFMLYSALTAPHNLRQGKMFMKYLSLSHCVGTHWLPATLHLL